MLTNVFSVPPSWLEKPSNREVTLGQKVELPCRADGSPTPKITWKKEIGKGTTQHTKLIYYSFYEQGLY